jgi:hypothetical protein
MAMPKELHMPSLQGLTSNRPALLVMLLAGKGPEDDLLRRHLTSSVRLVHLAIREYEQAREYLQTTTKSGQEGFGAFFDATDHLELCVLSIHRAMEACCAVLTHPSMKAYLNARKEQVNDAMDFLSSHEESLRRLRNGVVHIAEWIAEGKIAKGQAHILSVSEDGRAVSIGPRSVSLDDLGTLVKHLHQLAKVFSLYRADWSSTSSPPTT